MGICCFYLIYDFFFCKTQSARWVIHGDMLGGGRGFFLFLTFFNNILILTRIGFYLQEVARLVAPLAPARQIASVAPVHVARQGGPALA